jgi:hypothetical protein
MGSQSQHPIISILSWHFSFANLFQSILHSKIKQTIMGFKKKCLNSPNHSHITQTLHIFPKLTKMKYSN